MRVAIVGIGGMGCLFGAKLSQVANVTLVGHWLAQLKALREDGLKFIRPDGRSQTIHLAVTNNPEAAAPADLALILVKSSQTKQAAEVAKQLLHPNGVALTLQNGLGNLEQLTAVLGHRHSNLGITSEGATVIEPGTVRHAGHGQTHIAQQPNSAVPVQEIATLFQAAGLQTSLAADVAGLVWGKLAVNAGINPLTAVLQVPNGFLAENETARRLMQQAAMEVAQVAAAQQITLPFADAAQEALHVARATASNHSSMWQDVAQGRPTEIKAICGAVVEYGRQYSIPTPVNQVLLTAVRQIEQGNRAGAQTVEAILRQFIAATL
ncbi:2-dehydropantoate 2-reductase [hydrothermal vent metagenome]|uniref:2-dehydropantoate 2-reductase n=1 Tax=hydrothermal vent metagenome TaxID=652676 RepID=A0A3B0VIS7_9ZZZZ